jgi:hypothetical protein
MMGERGSDAQDPFSRYGKQGAGDAQSRGQARPAAQRQGRAIRGAATRRQRKR